jgi:hypothetical protein
MIYSEHLIYSIYLIFKKDTFSILKYSKVDLFISMSHMLEEIIIKKNISIYIIIKGSGEYH